MKFPETWYIALQMEVFTIRMTSAFIVMIIPFINLHTKLTFQVFIYFIYVAGDKYKLRIQTQVDGLRYGQKFT